jgi:cytochrome c-type biogenesis protein CcmF
MTGLGLLLAVWVGSTAVVNLVTRVREHPAPTWLAALRAQPGSYFGMLLAHFGVAVFIVGVTMVSSFSTESDVRMEPGESANAGGYSFRLESVTPVRGPNYTASRATLSVSLDGKPVATLTPERRVYSVTRTAMTEVAIDRGIGRDLYVALGEPVSASAWSIRVHHKPFVNWIWGGCVLMALGGVLAVLDRRYRTSRVRSSGSQGVSPAGAPATPATPALPPQLARKAPAP